MEAAPAQAARLSQRLGRMTQNADAAVRLSPRQAASAKVEARGGEAPGSRRRRRRRIRRRAQTFAARARCATGASLPPHRAYLRGGPFATAPALLSAVKTYEARARTAPVGDGVYVRDSEGEGADADDGVQRAQRIRPRGARRIDAWAQKSAPLALTPLRSQVRQQLFF